MERGKDLEGVRVARTFAIALALLALITLQSACTVITIHDSEGFTRIERKIGIAHITLAPTVAAAVSEVRSFGLVSGPMGVQAGLAWNRIAAASESCRVILWIEDAEQLDERTWRQINEAKNVCTVGKREK